MQWGLSQRSIETWTPGSREAISCICGGWVPGRSTLAVAAATAKVLRPGTQPPQMQEIASLLPGVQVSMLR